MKKSFFTLLMLYLFGQLTAQTWHWINPTTAHHHLNDISFAAAGKGIAVAANGVILHYNDSVWWQAESPVSVDLNAVYYLSPTLAWAVGNNGTIVKYNGSEWQQQTSPVSGQLLDVCFVDENHGWAVGSSILFYNGNTWQVQAETGGLKTVSFYTPNEGWAGSSSTNLFHFINGEWVQDNTFINGNLLSFNQIVMTGPSTVRMVGNDMNGSGVFYENTGTGWQLQASGTANAGISFPDHQHGFGIKNSGPFVFDTYPAIYKFTDGSWLTEYTARMKNMLTSVETINENEAYASDSIGFVYYGNEGNWGVSNGFTADSLLDIDFTQANNGYFACGTDGIWHYNAGNWTNELKLPGFRFNEVEFTDAENGWAAAYKEFELMPPFNYESKLFRFSNGEWTEAAISEFGDIWSPVSSIAITSSDVGFTFHNTLYSLIEENWEIFQLPLTDSITQLVYMDPFPIDAPENGKMQEWEAAWMSVKKSDSDTLGAIYYNNFLENNWSITYRTSTGAFNDLCVADYYNIYAVGDNGLIAHFDGQSWSEATPVTNEDLLSVYFSSYDRGWAVGRNGILLQYNGLAWSVEQSNTWNDLFKVNFYSNSPGLIGGQNGTLLSTTPQLPVGIGNPVKPALAPGLVIFPNPANDNAIIEFESPNGGCTSIDVYDIAGRLMLTKNHTSEMHGMQSIQMNLSNLKNGMYLLKISSGNQILQGKIVIQK